MKKATLVTGFLKNIQSNVGISRRANAGQVGIQGWYDLNDRQVLEGRGLFIERCVDGSVRRLVGFEK